MAEKTPAARGDTNFLDPARGLPILTENAVSPSVDHIRGGRENLKETIVYFDDLDAGDTWPSGIPGVVFFAFCTISDGTTRVTLSDFDTGTFTFAVSASNQKGFLLVKHAS